MNLPGAMTVTMTRMKEMRRLWFGSLLGVGIRKGEPKIIIWMPLAVLVR